MTDEELNEYKKYVKALEHAVNSDCRHCVYMRIVERWTGNITVKCRYGGNETEMVLPSKVKNTQGDCAYFYFDKMKYQEDYSERYKTY